MSYDLGTAHGKIVLDYDSDKAVGRAEHDIDKLERKAKESNGTLSKLGKTLAGFGAGAKIAGIATAMGAAAIQAAALAVNLLATIPALVSISSLAAALPGFFAGAVASVLILKAAFAGVGDAIKAALDPTKAAEYQKALEKLSPAARSFVEAIHKAAPELKTFQQSIQEAFFSSAKLAGQVPRMVKAFAELRPMVTGLAGDFGEVVRRLTNFALSADSIQFVSDAMQVFRAAVADSAGPLIKLATGFRDVGGVGLPLLLQMSDLVNKLIGQFGTWLSAVANDGRLQAWIDLALNTLQTLGEIAKNVGGILFAAIKAAQAAGGGLLGTLAEITGQFSAFLNSSEGMSTLTALFAGILQAAKALAPAIIILVGALGKALAPAIMQIATVLGPVLLDVVNALAPAFGPLAAAIAALVTALAPLLPPIAQLVALLAGVLSTAVQGLVAELGPLIAVIGTTLAQAFKALMPVVAAMAQGLPLAAKAGIALAQAFAPLAPVIVKLAQVIADQLVKSLPDLIKAMEPLIPVFVQFAQALSAQLISALNQLIPLIPILIQSFVKIAPILLQIMTIGIRLVTMFLNMSIAARQLTADIGKFAIGLVTGLVNGIKSAYNAVVGTGAAIIAWFQALPGRIIAFLAGLPGALKALFVKGLQDLATIIGFSAGLIVGIFTKLPGRIADAVVTLGPMLWAWMQNVWDGIRTRVINGINNTLAFLRNFPSRAYNAMVNLIALLRNLASSAWNNLQARFNAGVNNAANAARSLPGRIKSALGNLGGLLLNSGKAIIQGLANGISSGIDRVLNMLRDLGRRAREAFNNALNIFSPSKDFKQSGKFIIEGLLLGLKGGMDAVTRAAQALADAVIAPTVTLPATAGAAAMNVAVANPARTQQDMQSARQFGPYTIEVDGKVLAAIVIDTITGAPTVVSKTANEGDRQTSFAGSGRR